MFRNRFRELLAPRRRGVVLVMFAIMLVMIFAFVAFAIDVGYMSMVRTALQNAADGAALGGAQELGKGQGAVLAGSKAVALANTADGISLSLADTDIELGTFDLVKKTFTAVKAGNKANAVPRHRPRDEPPPVLRPGHGDVQVHHTGLRDRDGQSARHRVRRRPLRFDE